MTAVREGQPIKLQEDELAKLIRLSSSDRYLDLNWLTRGCELRDLPSNEWAMKELAVMRGITIQEARHDER